MNNMSLRLMRSKVISKARIKVMNEEFYKGRRGITSDIKESRMYILLTCQLLSNGINENS